MNITFLLGNGFDLQCDLKTSYPEFYEYILRKKYSIEMNEEFDEKLISKIDNIIYQEIYNSKDNIKTWADLEFQLGIFTKHLEKLYEEKAEIEKIADRFLHDYKILVSDLNDYLKSIQIKDDLKINEDFSGVLFETMESFYNGLVPKESDEFKHMLTENISSGFNYYFISFNYTNSLEKILKNCSTTSRRNIFNGSNYNQNVYDIINIHGKIDNSLTLGLNDESQLASNLFTRKILNYLIKPSLLSSSGNYRLRDSENIINNSDIIVIFGMSLGATDKYWWEKIGEKLLSNSDIKLIIHIHEENQSYVLQMDIMERRENKENEFLSHLDNLDLSEEQELQLRKQIYIVTNNQYIMNVKLSEYLNQDSEKSDKENKN